MLIRELHRWDLSYKAARDIQIELANRLQLKNNSLTKVDKIAGADVSYSKADDLLYAAVLVFSFPDLEIIEVQTSAEKVNFPYIPGLLSFREAPALLKVLKNIQEVPDVIIFDGQGIAHPRGLGLASHLGLFLDHPTIGCAKKRLVGDYENIGRNRGSTVLLKYKDKTVGAVVRTKTNVKPVFVSQGHKISLQQSIKLVLETARGFRLSEPVRRAHLAVNKYRREQQTGVISYAQNRFSV